jgi:hypothetical protein
MRFLVKMVFLKFLKYFCIQVIYLFEFGPNDYERYLEAFKREGVKILWENREKSILILPRTSKTHEIIKRLS